MSAQPHQYSLRVERANFLPDERAIREFVEQLRQELQRDPELRKRYINHPREVLAERGASLDLQRELLMASGQQVEALISYCPFTCLVTNINCGQTSIVGK